MIRLFAFLLFIPSLGLAQPVSRSSVRVAGAMRNVMWRGQLGGSIALDTLLRPHLYGLGPLEFLAGELLVADGRAYVATVQGDSMKVVESPTAKAPFFVYAQVAKWRAMPLPDSIATPKQLERYLDLVTRQEAQTEARQEAQLARPFAFRLVGKVAEATIHLVNLPSGASVSSPEQAHRGKRSYPLQAVDCELIGFFSTTHQGVFTHHDTYLHIHLITADRTRMGHLDDVRFAPGTMTLYLPGE
jgi:acetolactate decarboxylase